MSVYRRVNRSSAAALLALLAGMAKWYFGIGRAYRGTSAIRGAGKQGFGDQKRDSGLGFMVLESRG